MLKTEGQRIQINGTRTRKATKLKLKFLLILAQLNRALNNPALPASLRTKQNAAFLSSFNG